MYMCNLCNVEVVRECLNLNQYFLIVEDYKIIKRGKMFLSILEKVMYLFIVFKIYIVWQKMRMLLIFNGVLIFCVVQVKQILDEFLFKGNKFREFLKNWRLILLLNVIYKLLFIVLVNYLKLL